MIDYSSSSDSDSEKGKPLKEIPKILKKPIKKLPKLQ